MNTYFYCIDYTITYHSNKIHHKHTTKGQKYAKYLSIAINMAYFSLSCFLPFIQ